MAYYSYYGQAPNYGSPSYQFSAPPVPSYQPQPSWGGGDYYRAHYGIQSDDGMFDWVWNRVKNYVTGSVGVGREEAKHWHRRVYGGMVDIKSLSTTELGAAAGFEAYRLWEHHKSIYRQPLMDDREREREALVGLAIAEASKLMGYMPRVHDHYGRREVSEVAASTAERIFRHYDGDMGYDSFSESGISTRRARSRSRSRRRGSYGGSGYLSDEFDDPLYESRRRERRRSSGSSYYSSAQPGNFLPGQPAYIPGAAPMPIAGAPMPGVSPYGPYATAQPQIIQQQPGYAYGVPGTSPSGYGGLSTSPVGYNVLPGGGGAYTVSSTPAGYSVGASPYMYQQQPAQNVQYAYPTTAGTTTVIPPTAGALVIQGGRGRRRSVSSSYYRA